MKKTFISLFMASICILALLTGCTRTETEQEAAKENITSTETNSTAIENAGIEDTSTASTDTENAKTETVTVASLKGPTSMGLAALMDKAERKETKIPYEFIMETSADTLLPMVLKGEADIALVPANVASALYNKTLAMDVESDIVVIDINTLGVLYLVTGNDKVSSMKDLEGKTIYLTGKGTTPDYVLNYLLTENQVQNVTLEYKSEAAEVAAILKENPEAVGLLPQPFATAACMQNEALKEAVDLNKEWEALQGEAGSSLVTGVTIARKTFVQEHSGIVKQFLKEHKESIAYVNENSKEAASLIVKAGIVEKEPVAQKAIPKCNLTYMDGEEMKQALSGYLEVLYNQNPDSIGGALPLEEFYYE